MSQTFSSEFLEESARKSFDLEHREIMHNNIANYTAAFNGSKTKFLNLDNSKKKANLIKWKTIEHLDRYLNEFEANFVKRGGKVIWANDAEEARQEIWKIFKEKNAKSAVKARAALTEEIDLNDFLQKNGIEVLESDIGTYIVQLMEQKPDNFATAAMHLNHKQIAQLFHEKFDMPEGSTSEQIIRKVRELLREKFLNTDIAITGADFLIAETGSIAISEDEGNARLASTFPKTHIVIAGIENIVPTINDLDLFWPLLASHSVGQNLTSYNSILSGPRQHHETDGPDDMHVILIDNGRTNLLEKTEQRQGLYCIHCGSCLNVCPVYQNSGGQAYKNIYQGPIGSLIAPHLRGIKEFKHLSYASTLCGKCTEACPVGIDIQKMLLLNRRDAVKENLATSEEKRGWKWFVYIVQKRKWLDLFGGKTKNFIMRYFFKKAWGKNRELPNFPNKSFSKQWKEQHKE